MEPSRVLKPAAGGVSGRAFGSACVLAGGRGRRLEGRDKLYLELGGERLLRRVERQLRSAFGDIVAATGRPEAFAGLGYRIVPDALPGLGPLSGLLAGLRAARSRWVYLAACDMPFFSESWAGELMARARAIEDSGSGVLAVAARAGPYHEPFHALYNVGLATLIERRLAEPRAFAEPRDREGPRAPSLQSLAREAPFEYVDFDGFAERERVEAAGKRRGEALERELVFGSVNTPSDIERFESALAFRSFDRIDATGAYWARLVAESGLERPRGSDGAFGRSPGVIDQA